MPEFISGRPRMVQTIETLMVSGGIMKIKHDGGGLLSQLPPSWRAEQPANMFTRRFEIQLNGKNTGIQIKFCYNNRDDWADIKIGQLDLNYLNARLRKVGKQNEGISLHEVIRDKAVSGGNEDDGDNSGSLREDGVYNGVQKSGG